MREIDDIQATSGLPRRGWLLLAAFLLIGLGVALGRWAFPQEVIKFVIFEKGKLVRVENEKFVKVPVERIVEKRVEVPVDRIMYRDRPVPRSNPSAAASDSSIDILDAGYSYLRLGIPKAEVIRLVGLPYYIHPDGKWYYYSTRTNRHTTLIFLDKALADISPLK